MQQLAHSRISKSCLSPFPFLRGIQADSPFSSQTQVGGITSLGQGQVPQLGRRWETAGQPGRLRALESPPGCDTGCENSWKSIKGPERVRSNHCAFA